MNTLNTMPGFTAEASLYDAGSGFQASVGAEVQGGPVQAAEFPFSTDATLDGSHAYLGPVYIPKPTWCFTRRCKNVAPPGRPPRLLCTTVLGIWNSFTRTCDAI